MTAGSESDPDSYLYVLIGFGTLTSATAQWLAFFPPRAYREWVARRSAEGPGAAQHG